MERTWKVTNSITRQDNRVENSLKQTALILQYKFRKGAAAKESFLHDAGSANSKPQLVETPFLRQLPFFLIRKKISALRLLVLPPLRHIFPVFLPLDHQALKTIFRDFITERRQ